MFDISVFLNNIWNTLSLIYNLLSIMGLLFMVIQFMEWILPYKINLFKNYINKPIRSFLNRETNIQSSVFKHYTSQEELDYVFNEFIEIFSEEHNFIKEIKPYSLRLSFNKRDIPFDITITVNEKKRKLDLYYSHYFTFKFKNFEKYINAQFDILSKLDKITTINSASNNIEINFSSDKFQYFNNFRNIIGESFYSDNLKVNFKENGKIEMNFSVENDINSIDYIKNNLELAFRD